MLAKYSNKYEKKERSKNQIKTLITCVHRHLDQIVQSNVEHIVAYI